MSIELGTHVILFWCSALSANFTLLVRLRILRSFFGRDLLILVKLSEFKSELLHKQKVG